VFVPRRSRSRLAALVLGAGLVLAGCSAPGQVKDYNQQVADNFVTKCVEANESKGPNPQDMCKCWFDKIKTDFSFAEFKSLDSALQTAVKNEEIKSPKDLQDKFPRYYTLVTENCVSQGPAAN
jgi:hypothetical protein